MLFAVRGHNIPGGVIRIGGLEHGIPGTRIIIPAVKRFRIHRAQLPYLPLIIDAILEATLLFIHAYVEPLLDQDNLILEDHLLERRGHFKKTFIFMVGAKTHDTFDPGTVVPAAIEQNNLPRRREVL